MVIIYRIELPRVKRKFFLTPEEHDKIEPLLKRLRELAKDSEDLGKTYRLYEEHGWERAAERVLEKIKNNLSEEEVIEQVIVRIIEEER